MCGCAATPMMLGGATPPVSGCPPRGELRSWGAITLLSFELCSPRITHLKIDCQMQRGTLKPKKCPSENW